MTLVLMNGRVVPEKEAVVSVLDPAFQFAEGVFTTIRVKDRVVEHLQAHFVRLQENAKKLGFQAPHILEKDIENLVKAVCPEKGLWKIKIILLPPQKDHGEARYFAFAEPFLWNIPDTYSLHTIEGHLPFSAQIKSLAYVDRRMAKAVVQNDGYDDALFIDRQQVILETSCANIFWKIGKKIYTPSRMLPLLFGVTIENMSRVVKSMGYEYKEVEETQIPEQASVFVTNVMIWFRPVTKIDKRSYKRDLDFEEQLHLQLQMQLV